MSGFPTPPDVPDDQRDTAESFLRYEDFSQDGRVLLLSLVHLQGLTLWQRLLSNHPLARAAAQTGVMPIFTRLVIEGAPGPFSLRRPVTAEGRYQLAHTADESGAPSRILLNTWTTVTGPRRRPSGDGFEPVLAGRLYSEHVFTRLFAPPDQRKVLRLDLPGVEPVPAVRVPWHPPEELAAPPAGARVLDDTPGIDPATIVFGLTHTDNNQHVNSLVYARLFEDAALRRFDALGRRATVLARHAELRYRKPCFAGDRMALRLTAFELDGRLGASGAFLPAEEPDARPHCTVSMLFDP